MSKPDLNWSEANAEAARQAGFQLVPTFDNGKKKPHLRIYDVEGNARTPYEMTAVVTQAAAKGSKLCVAALKAVMASRVTK